MSQLQLSCAFSVIFSCSVVCFLANFPMRLLLEWWLYVISSTESSQALLITWIGSLDFSHHTKFPQWSTLSPQKWNLNKKVSSKVTILWEPKTVFSKHHRIGRLKHYALLKRPCWHLMAFLSTSSWSSPSFYVKHENSHSWKYIQFVRTPRYAVL